MPEAKLRVCVLASGLGSNLQAIIDAIEAGKLAARIAVVISNKKDAQALERARRHGVADVFLDPAPYKDRPDSREAYDRAVLDVLRKHNVELVALAGYMKIVTQVLIDAYPNRIMNIHPALLPSFPGLRAQKQALDHGVKVSGCTVHFVDEGIDTGPIFMQRAVPVFDSDTEHVLAERILKVEHELYPEALSLFSKGNIRIEGRKVSIEKKH